MVHEEEGFGFVALFVEPIESKVGDGVGGVEAVFLDDVLGPGPVAHGAEFGVVVFSLAGEDAVVVEVGGFDLEVPFADHGGVVSGFAEFDREHLFAGFDFAGEVVGTVDVVVLAGESTGAGGGADRVGAEGVFEEHALVGEAVDVGGGGDLGEAAAVGADGVGGVVVGHDVEDVGRLRGKINRR